ncbi:hypothetical protein M1367_02490 [Candidatus Marsarchaeota archaeon]|nr:hypothetical protein [Candidatus Marsarchaeota archaeon]
MHDNMRSVYKEYTYIAIAYLLITLAFFWPIMVGKSTGIGGDTAQSMWELWWVPFSLFTLHAQPYFTLFVYFPVGANLATQTLAPLAGIFFAPLQALGLPAELNIFIVVSFALSGLFAYMLAFHFTHSKLGSLAAGFIYTFAPMHIAQSYSHLQWISIGFIPLFLLFMVKLAEEKKPSYAAYAGISFVLLTFMGDIEQGIIAALVAFLAVVYVLAVSRKLILNKKVIVGAVVLVATVAILGSPFFLYILKFVASPAFAQTQLQSSLNYNVLYSPDLLSFFVPGPMNMLFSGLTSNVYYIFAADPTERTAYLGYTVIVLALLGIFYDRKNKLKNTGIFIFLAAVLLLLSYGPYLQVNGVVTKLPGLYLAYHYIPLINSLREPGRFDMVAMLFVAVLAAFGFRGVEQRLKSRSSAYAAFAVVVILLLIEYNAIPMGSLAAKYGIAYIPKAYTEIGNITGNFSVLVLPALPNLTSAAPNYYPGLELYYQTAMKKPLVGGYTTRFNSTQQYVLESMPLIGIGTYLQSNTSAYYTPLNENFTKTDLFLLDAYGTRFVSIARSAYSSQALNELVGYLGSFLGSPVYVSNSTIVFSTYNAISSTSISTPVAYTPAIAGYAYSMWQPGSVLCGSSPYCNNTFKSVWWLQSTYAFINIYAPARTTARISMLTMAYPRPTLVYVYDDASLVSRVPFNTSESTYTFNASLGQGVNQIVLVDAINSTIFGIDNFTVSG